MPVILLDPALPDMIPVRAVPSMTGHVFVTEDVHPSLLWNLPSYEFASSRGQLPFGAVVLSSDRSHPVVQQLLSRGDAVISGDALPGTRLLEAVALMDKLRRTGPWEGQQTHDSLRRYLIEEVYELLDAFDRGDSDEMCSELGDLLLQVLFHARIAEDSAQGAFDIDDVAQSFITKVSYRTPGVLAGEHADLERQIREWEEQKAAERNRGSVLDGLVTSQPSLALTQKLFERLAAAAFPRDAISPSLTRIDISIRKHARDSAEDTQRHMVLQLMTQVRAAENAAGVDGVIPRSEDTWRKYLGMSYDESGLAAPTLADRAEPRSETDDRATPQADGRAESRSEADGRAESRSQSDGRATPQTDGRAKSRPDVETTGEIPTIRDIAPSTDPRAFYFAFPKPGDPAPSQPTAHRSREPEPVSEFPEPDDFPGPPPSHRFVGSDPIEATERELSVSFGTEVPRMVVRNQWDDEDDH